MTTLAEALAHTVGALRAAAVRSPEVDARWLIEAATGLDPRHHPDHPLTDPEAEVLTALRDRRADREPLQLVIGATDFRMITLRCRTGVFVPRPETEILAGLAVDLVRATARPTGAPVVVHEPCCGTGAVGLAIASEVDGAVVLLGDRSEAAVALASENRDALARQGALRSSVEVHQGDLLSAFLSSAHRPPDLIVANPPYLPHSDLDGLEPEVAVHDPHGALFGGEDGHEVVDVLLADAREALVPGGVVLLEIDARRAGSTLAHALDVGLVDASIHHDLNGAPRFVVARRPGPDLGRR